MHAQRSIQCPPRGSRSPVHFAAHFVPLAVASLIATLALAGGFFQATLRADDNGFSLKQARADFEQVVDIIAHRHPKLFTDHDQLAATIAAGRQRLHDGMTEVQLLRVLAPVSHATLCGHTSIMLSEKSEAALHGATPLIPVDVRLIDNRLYVIGCRAPVDLPAGAEILSINGHATPAILDTLRASLPAEGQNETFAPRLLAFFFPILVHQFVDTAREFHVDYAAPGDSAPRSILIPGVELPRFTSPAAPPGGPVDPNRCSFEPDRAVMTIGSFNFYENAGRRRFQKFIADSFGEIKKRGLRHLIIDLRNNGGGDPTCAASLFTHLIDRPAPYFTTDTPGYDDLKTPLAPAKDCFDGDTYILINGGCFSSVGHLCALLKHHKAGVFIGEETAGSFACSDASTTVTLRHSKLRFRHSQQVFAAAVTGLPAGRGTLPDIPVAPTLADCLDHRDPVMARALELARVQDKGAHDSGAD